MRVLIELRHTWELYTAAVDHHPAEAAVNELAAIEGVEVDGSYPPAQVPLRERLEETAAFVSAASLFEPDAARMFSERPSPMTVSGSTSSSAIVPTS